MKYNPETHQYFLADGTEVPSVTKVIRGLSDYSKIPPYILKKAADRGTMVHRLCELRLQNNLDEESLSDEQKRYLEQFNLFIDKTYFDFSCAICEEPLVHEKLKFGGTPDIVLEDNIFDIKTCDYKKSHDIQLAGYGLLVKHEISAGDYEHWVVELKPDKYRLIKCKDKQAESKFINLLKKWKE